MTPVLAASVLVWAGRSLRESFFMFWDTLWPLVLGFGLSGAVQAFVAREQMERVLGDHRPRTVARASGYGMVSSSCSYAATAMAKSLFAKGADFVTAMVFMVASTNLVVELGIVLVILMGWQFAAAEFIGGPIMIALLAFVGGWVFARRLTDPARRRLAGGQMAEGHDHQAMVGVSDERQAELEHQPWAAKLRSKAAWSDAASYTMADLTMLRKELVIGYVIAGFLAVLVPTHVWNVVFVHGHGFWTSLENVVVGPAIAVISFVCSIGNVPLAAALWKGGISFGGVISFLFADLISFPLLLIYRKYYGTKLTLRILVSFWVVMAAGGLVVEGLFAVFGLEPHRRTTRIVETSFHWNYTTFLNIAFLAVFAGLYWLYRNRERLGGGEGYGIDPVCGMQIRTANAPAQRTRGGHRLWFCSDHCAQRFDADPGRYASKNTDSSESSEQHDAPSNRGLSAISDDDAGSRTVKRQPEGAEPHFAVDPVCGMRVDTARSVSHRRYAGHDEWFCSPGCVAAFDADPAQIGGPADVTDPMCGMTLNTAVAAAHRTHDDEQLFFCSPACAERFDTELDSRRGHASRPDLSG